MTIDDVKLDENSKRIEKVLGKLTGDYTGDLGEAESVAEVLLNKLIANGGISQGGTTSGGTTNYTNLTNKPTINGNVLIGDKKTSQLQLDYKGLVNLPSINGVTIVGQNSTADFKLSYPDLMNLPTINGEKVTGDMILTLGTSNYLELDNKPTFNGVELKGDVNFELGYTDYTLLKEKPRINGRELIGNTKLTLGVTSYNDISDKPTINGTEVSGNMTLDLGTSDYNDISNKPKINGVDLKGELTTSDLGIDIPTSLSKLTNDVDFVTAEKVNNVLKTYATLSSITDSLNSYYTKEEVDAKVSAPFNYKGEVADTVALNAITDPSIGDVYKVGTVFYIRNETEWSMWDGALIDLSNYVQKSDIVSGTTNGLMSTSDKIKLNGIQSNADVSSIKTISINGVKIEPDDGKNIDISIPINGVSYDGSMVSPDTNGIVWITPFKYTPGDNIEVSESGVITATYKVTAGDGIDITNNKISVTRKTIYVSDTLYSAGWHDGIYSFEESYPFKEYDISLELDGDRCSVEQFDAWTNGKVVKSGSTNTIKILGMTIKDNIPVVLKITNK